MSSGPALPGCEECGGAVRHARTCSAFDAMRVLVAHGGACRCYPDREPGAADCTTRVEVIDSIVEAFGLADVNPEETTCPTT